MRRSTLYTNVTILLVFVAGFSVQQDYTILRTVDSSSNEHPWSSRDKFNVTAAKCRQSFSQSQNPCLEYGSFTPSKTCFCKCPYVTPTFIYQDNSWKCRDDNEMRRKEGCGFMFDTETSSSMLTYMTPTYTAFINVPVQNTSCNVDESTSEYYTCDNSWKLMKNIVRSTPFEFELDSIRNGQQRYRLKINWTSVSRDLPGRIIKLDLTCVPASGKPCLLYKVAGIIDCPADPLAPPSTVSLTKTTTSTFNLSSSSQPLLLPPPPSSPSATAAATSSAPSSSLHSLSVLPTPTASSTTTTTTTKTTRTTRISMTTSTSTSISTSHLLVPFSYSSLRSPSLAISVTPSLRAASSSATPIDTNKPPKNRQSDDTDTSERLVIIIGPVAGIVAVAVIFIVAVFILLRRRKSREKTPPPEHEAEDGKRYEQTSVKQSVNDQFAQANPIYEPKPHVGKTLQVETAVPEYINMKDAAQPQPTAKTLEKNKKKKKDKSDNNSKKGGLATRIQNRLGSASSTEILLQPNQENLDQKTARKLSKYGKNSDNLSDHNNFNDAGDDDEWSGFEQEGYENLAFSHGESNNPIENPYSTIGNENAYETVANIRSSTSAEREIKGGRHIYDRAEGNKGRRVAETTGTRDCSDQAEAMDGGSCGGHIYDRAEENISLPLESVKDSQNNEQVHDFGHATKDAGSNGTGDNIYDRAEGYEGQPLATPKGTRLSDEFSRSVLSNIFRNAKEKSFHDSYEDGDYDSPEAIIVA